MLFRIIISSALLLSLAGSIFRADRTVQPNVVLFYIDDMGYGGDRPL